MPRRSMSSSKIPPDVRRQLEADIEWVQGIASLYFAVSDTHARHLLSQPRRELLPSAPHSRARQP